MDSASYTRVAAVGRTTSGRIYERAFTVDGTATTSWTWSDLSTYRVELQKL